MTEARDPMLDAGLPIGYDSAIVDDFFRVMCLLEERRPIYYTEIAKQLGLDIKCTHLILEVLGDADITEYGTSPRGSWLTPEGEQLLKRSRQYREGVGE